MKFDSRFLPEYLITHLQPCLRFRNHILVGTASILQSRNQVVSDFGEMPLRSLPFAQTIRECSFHIPTEICTYTYLFMYEFIYIRIISKDIQSQYLFPISLYGREAQ